MYSMLSIKRCYIYIYIYTASKSAYFKILALLFLQINLTIYSDDIQNHCVYQYPGYMQVYEENQTVAYLPTFIQTDSSIKRL